MMRMLRPTRLLQVLIILAVLSFIVRLNNVITSDAFTEGKSVGAILEAGAKEEKPALEKKDAEDHGSDGGKTEEPPKEKAGIQKDKKGFQRNFSQAEIELLQSLAKRRAELDKREKALGTQEALLTAAEQEVDRKINELASLRQEMEVLLGKQQELEESRLKSLVKVYENMKPKQAAGIFNTMEMNILIQVMSRMSERKMAPILAAMDKKRAQDLTIRLAEQHQLPKLPN